MSPSDQVNPLYCILIWSIYTIYVRRKLGPGEKYFDIENGDDPIVLNFDFNFNYFALKHVSTICIWKKITTKVSLFKKYLLCLIL